MKYTPEEVAKLLANRPNQPHYIEAMIRRCIDAATQPSAEPVAWIEVRDDGEEPDLTADPLWAKHYPGKWLPLFLHPSPADEAVRRDAEIGRLVRLKLTSGNSVPVERCTVTAAEIAAIEAARGGKQ